MEDQIKPSFASVLEPAQLQRPHCDQCRVAIADYECQRCIQRFCRQCELVIHHRLAELAVKNEESKSDGRPHQEFLKWISACQVCGQNTQEFFCLSCNAYQCESCCATKHRQSEPHFFFCVEGSSPKMLPFASWNSMFVEMVKVSKGNLQDRAVAAEAAMARTSTSLSDSSKLIFSSTKDVVAATSTGATASALGNLSIDGPAASPIITQQARRQTKHSARVFTSSVVDLTLDDESDSSYSASIQAPTQLHIKTESRGNADNTWLASATAAYQNPVHDLDEQMEKIIGDDEDPVLRSMICEYNALSSKIFDIDQVADRVKKKTKELSGAKPINMQEVQKALAMTQQFRKDKTNIEKIRDGVVANIVVYLKTEPNEIKAFLKTCTADVPTAQTAIHRKCATYEASILSNLKNIQRVQRNMEDLMRLKKDAFAEVTRLGAEIAQSEEEVRRLDKERREEFLTLCQFSKSIQAAIGQVISDL